MRLINADNIQGKLATLSFYTDGTFEGKIVEYVRGLIDAQPTIDAVPVVHAHWIHHKSFLYGHIVTCSRCGNSLNMNGVNGGRGDANFCPNCGAKMDEEEEEEEEKEEE